MQTISIIVAAKNEAQSLPRCIERIFAVYPHAEVIVVDGGSDTTPEVMRGLLPRFPTLRYIQNEGDRGKGHAIRVGIESSSGDIMVQIDADLQFLPEEIPSLVQPLRDDRADMVLGSRFSRGSSRGEGGTPLLRTLGNLVMSGYASILFAKRMRDVMAGLKAWRRSVISSFHLMSDDYSYEIELPAKAIRAGWRVVDIPVTTVARETGASSVRVFRVGCKALYDITRFRFVRL